MKRNDYHICPLCGGLLERKSSYIWYCEDCDERFDDEYSCPKCGGRLTGWYNIIERTYQMYCLDCNALYKDVARVYCEIYGISDDKYDKDLIICPKCGKRIMEDFIEDEIICMGCGQKYDDREEDIYSDEFINQSLDKCYDNDYCNDRSVSEALDGPEGYYNVFGEWPEGYDPETDTWNDESDDEDDDRY